MNPDYEQKLTARIEAELKALGEMEAPPMLASRIMKAVRQQTEQPWYRRSWPSWQPMAQAASLALLVALFALMSYGVWQGVNWFSQSGLPQKIESVVAGAGAIWKAMAVLGDSAKFAISRLNAMVVAGGLAFVALAYAMCVGLGTVCVRLAWRPSGKRFEL